MQEQVAGSVATASSALIEMGVIGAFALLMFGATAWLVVFTVKDARRREKALTQTLQQLAPAIDKQSEVLADIHRELCEQRRVLEKVPQAVGA